MHRKWYDCGTDKQVTDVGLGAAVVHVLLYDGSVPCEQRC